MGRNGLVETLRLRITPTANRNSCRVARLVGVHTQGSVLRPQPWAGKTQLRQSCCCLGCGLLRVLPTIFCVREGDEINTKSRCGGWRLRLGGDVGADCRKTSFPPCRFHHPHRHARHGAILRDDTKSGLWPFKKSGFRRCKNSCLLEAPSKPFPMGWGFYAVLGANFGNSYRGR